MTDDQMIPCPKGCGVSVHRENVGFHVCPSSNQRCSHKAGWYRNPCPWCQVERLRAALTKIVQSHSGLDSYDDLRRYARNALEGLPDETTPVQTPCDDCKADRDKLRALLFRAMTRMTAMLVRDHLREEIERALGMRPEEPAGAQEVRKLYNANVDDLNNEICAAIGHEFRPIDSSGQLACIYCNQRQVKASDDR